VPAAKRATQSLLRPLLMNAELHRVTGLQRAAELGDVVRRVHRLTVDGYDHVAGLQADVIGERNSVRPTLPVRRPSA
jgi:hypothetical protein